MNVEGYVMFKWVLDPLSFPLHSIAKIPINSYTCNYPTTFDAPSCPVQLLKNEKSGPRRSLREPVIFQSIWYKRSLKSHESTIGKIRN